MNFPEFSVPRAFPRRGVAAPGRAGADASFRQERGDAGYPARLESAMGEEAPRSVWISGAPVRVDASQIAFVGSRGTAPALLSAAHRLARALSEAGWVVASGCARGADSAALEGALAGRAGALGVPASGFSALPPAFLPGARPGLTLLAVAPPFHPFNAGHALRRNAVIGSLADGLVLVAAGRKSGSWYAVRRALSRGAPVFCLECGKETPEGNAWLLSRGLAWPLPAQQTRAVEVIESAVRTRAPEVESGPGRQMDLLEGLIGRAA